MIEKGGRLACEADGDAPRDGEGRGKAAILGPRQHDGTQANAEGHEQQHDEQRGLATQAIAQQACQRRPRDAAHEGQRHHHRHAGCDTAEGAAPRGKQEKGEDEGEKGSETAGSWGMDYCLKG